MADFIELSPAKTKASARTGRERPPVTGPLFLFDFKILSSHGTVNGVIKITLVKVGWAGWTQNFQLIVAKLPSKPGDGGHRDLETWIVPPHTIHMDGVEC